jgi:hypothetical protein
MDTVSVCGTTVWVIWLAPGTAASRLHSQPLGCAVEDGGEGGGAGGQRAGSGRAAGGERAAHAPGGRVGAHPR